MPELGSPIDDPWETIILADLKLDHAIAQPLSTYSNIDKTGYR